MGVRIFAGNLPWRYSSDDLAELFAEFGTVESAEVCRDPITGRSRGFGFVEVATRAAALLAIEELDGTECDGRQVNIYRARSSRRREVSV